MDLKIDNSITTPFKPLLPHKPHALKSLDLTPIYAANGSVLRYPHPYAFELDNFRVPEHQLTVGMQIEPRDLSNTPLEFIKEKQELMLMINELKGANAIAVDVEEYRYHSYQGLTCLVQISTRKKDFIIDAIALRNELHILNEIFANPNIVKVFHGANGDIVWLQRDLSVYVVNMFDTHQACRKLNLPQKSLGYLMACYCGVVANKSREMKTADWRYRPLPDILIRYAREDTHYLLYIYDCLRRDLLVASGNELNLLQDVYDASTDICKMSYEKPKVTPESHKRFISQMNLEFNNRQMFALNKLMMWRDKVAREQDEGWGLVLPNNAMIAIAENLPLDTNALLACVGSTNSGYVQKYLPVLRGIIKFALNEPLEVQEE